MCLSIVTTNKHDPSASGTDWKVFRVLRNKLYPMFFALSGPSYGVGVWYETYGFTQSDKRRVDSHLPPGKPYWRGFHLYTQRSDALLKDSYTRAARKVRWRYLLATGYQTGARCIVAKEIMIIPTRAEAKANLA